MGPRSHSEPPWDFGPVDTGAYPGSEQAVAAAQVVIQETQRGPHREGVQPERHLGEFHRHRVLVDAIDAALEHHAPDNVTVVELVLVNGPATGVGIRHDPGADIVDPCRQWREVAVHRGFGLRHRRDHAISEIVHEVDQKVSRTHGGIADLQVEQLLGRIEWL